MAPIVKPYVLQAYLFTSCGRDDNKTFANLRALLSETPGATQRHHTGWRHVYAFGRFDFAALRLTRRLYGSDLGLFNGEFLDDVEDVAEMVWFEWGDSDDGDPAEKQAEQWSRLWASGLPIFALIFITPCQGWEAGESPGAHLETTRLLEDQIEGAFGEGLREKLDFIVCAGIGPEPLAMCLCCRDFGVLFELIDLIESVPRPDLGATEKPRPAFEHVRTLCGISLGSGSGRQVGGLEDELQRLEGNLGEFSPTVSLNTMAGAAPFEALEPLRQLRHEMSLRAAGNLPNAGPPSKDILTALGTVDYQVQFSDSVPACQLVRKLFECRNIPHAPVAKLETIVASPWNEEREHRKPESVPADEDEDDTQLRKRLGETAGLLKRRFVPHRELPALVEAATFMLERGCIFLQNRSTRHLISGLAPFLSDLCDRLDELDKKVELLFAVSAHLDAFPASTHERASERDAVLAEVDPKLPTPGSSLEDELTGQQQAVMDEKLAELMDGERFLRDEVEAECNKVRLTGIDFARALRQGASGDYRHLFDSNLQARADSHFASYRRFILAAEGILHNLYAIAEPLDKSGMRQKFRGFVTMASERGFETKTAWGIANVPFHLVRNPETLHVLGHEFGHQLTHKLDAEDAVWDAVCRIPLTGETVSGVAETIGHEAGGPLDTRRLLNETLADITWAVATLDQAEPYDLNELPALLSRVLTHHGCFWERLQVQDFTRRLVCACLAGEFHRTQVWRRGQAVADARASRVVGKVFDECRSRSAAGNTPSPGGLLDELRPRSPALCRVASLCFDSMRAGGELDYIATVALVVARVLADDVPFGRALRRLSCHRMRDGELAAVALGLLDGRVPSDVPPGLLGTRLCWSVERELEALEPAAANGRAPELPSLQTRLALMSVLEHAQR